ncbi:uncharacterized protein LOC102628600 isoform X3 [Citrus sinensis]|nr:uncharacterized protein LOC102628600 isoform X3 [Citrus sinensis]XP_024951123.2 uncharacterized protein LOC102628600 isoform X3 [Citrus sinensis]XP_024951126.2 uncharacterized protein LOC102628600 isoform X3 [Citrus sinensis]XP_052292662.1 uncharacterized protein LOC102628600 isoform X3 [Citrus sinensis]XP_052292663.1 uncharacterized protein LOC102628600 isoform X3 [Citrus sinensis]
MDSQQRKRKRQPGGLQKKGAPMLRANGQDAVPTSSTYGFVSYFNEEVKRLRSENSDLSVTLGLRKHIGKTYKELPPEQKARYKKRDERMGNSGNSNSHSGDNEIMETKCVPERFCALVKSLSEEKKKAIREIGFESLLELRCGKLKRKLCHWLVNQFKPERNIIELHGKKLELCPKMFSKIMGVKDGGMGIKINGASDHIAEVRRIFQPTVKGIRIRTLEEVIEQLDEANKIFKVAFTLFAIATLLCPIGSYISTLFLHPIMDVSSIKSLNWATFCYDWLVKSICRFQNQQAAYIGGCLHFLQIFYLHNVAYDNIQPDRNILPITFWNESRIKKFMKWLRSKGGIGSDKIKIRYFDTSGVSQQNIVGYPNFEEIFKKQCFALRILTLKVDEIIEAISGQTTLLDKVLHVRKTRGHSSSPGNRPTTGAIQSPSPDFVSPQEKYRGTLVEISSTEGSVSCRRGNPYDDSILDSKERQLLDLLCRLEGALDGESNDTFQSKPLEMGKQTTKAMEEYMDGHIQHSRDKNVISKSCRLRFSVGPFTIPSPISEDAKQLILYLFDDKLNTMYDLIYTNCFYDNCICKVCSNIIILLLFVEITPFFHGKREIVVDIGDNSITRSSMRTLLPGEWIDGDIITMYADYKNMKEAEKDVTSPRCWFLPTYYSQAALADWSSLNFAQAAGFRDRYMSRLDTCEKIYVPINSDGHWYMLVVDISHATATIWDSLESPSRREKMINESLAILASLDFVLRQEARALFCNQFTFLNFQICRQAGLPQQPNGFDCGYYVMKYMDSPCIVVHDSYQHDSDHARLLLALYLVQSPLNKIRCRLIQEARKL